MENQNTQNQGYENIKFKFVNMILDNGLAITLTVGFCFVIYYILHKHNELLLEQIYKLIKDKEQLIDQLLECYEYRETSTD